ncbi:MAG: hypothetical protein A2176_13810 [Spirochaetes bacterium RBG_13_51_14]|nr:MAG: hypothetical protein A2176_13810 [Spirochaetes bacterium RBG_13_51_14]
MGAITIPLDQLEKRYGSSEDKYLTYEGMRIRYRDEGRGPVLVLLHGVCSSLDTCDGGVELLDAFANRVGVNGFYLAGNSLGGYVAWNYALKYPRKVKKLILIDSVGYNQKLPWLLDFASSPGMRPLARSMMPRSMIYNAVKQVFGDKSKVSSKIQKRYFDFAMREGNRNAWVDIFIGMREQTKSAGLSRDIPNIKVPTLIMWGKKDEWIPYAHVELWKKDLSSASFITYDDAGHIPMEEIPERTAGDALKFLR